MEFQGVGHASGRRWPKGVSGNRAGRPRADPQINGMLRLVRLALLQGAHVTIILPDGSGDAQPAVSGGA